LLYLLSYELSPVANRAETKGIFRKFLLSGGAFHARSLLADT
jgi:hypothetical protein